MCLPSSIPSGGHRPWVLSFITASLKPRARGSTARSCSPHLPSLLLLPFSNRVAFSSFICLWGRYVIRAGVLMGKTKWSSRGAGFGSCSGHRSSECYSCPFHLLSLLPWACQHQANSKSLGDVHRPILLQWNLVFVAVQADSSTPPSREPWSSVSIAAQRSKSPSTDCEKVAPLL